MSVPLSDFMGASMGKVREMIDVNTVVGDPIHTDDGVTIIPVSKVSFGFAGGASDIPSKHVPPEKSVYGAAPARRDHFPHCVFDCQRGNGADSAHCRACHHFGRPDYRAGAGSG